MLLTLSTHATISSGSYAQTETATATGVGASSYDASDVDFVERFQQCSSKWRSETYHVSNATQMFSHASFKEIVGLGERVVPLILNEIRQRPSWIVVALEDILHRRPYEERDQGNLRAMIDAWLVWDPEAAG